jgi:hypothetical protein
MAHKKKKRSTSLVVRSRPRTSKPIVIRQTKVVKAKHRRKGGGRSAMGFAGDFLSKRRVGVALGAAAFGFLEAQPFMKSIPALPVIGVEGTVAVGAFLLSDNGKNELAGDICTAAIVLAAHKMTSSAAAAKTSGDYVAGEDASNVGYVAGY